MISDIKEANKAWLQLEPSRQFLVWSVGSTVLSGVLIVLFALLSPFVAGEYTVVAVNVVTLGILLLALTFVMAILYLTVIWPHFYEKYKKPDEK